MRLAGLSVAAVWLGGTVFYVLALDPLFGNTEVIRLLGPLHAGETAWLAVGRFQMFQVICASLAIVHALAEWLYSGRGLDRRLMVLLVLLLGLASFGRMVLTPKCRGLNAQAYLTAEGRVVRTPQTPAQRRAENGLAVWHGVTVVAHVLSLAGVGLYFLHEVSIGNVGPRLFSRSRLRL